MPLPEPVPSKAGAVGRAVTPQPLGSLSERAAMQGSAASPLYTRKNQVHAPVEMLVIKREEFGIKTKKAKTCQEIVLYKNEISPIQNGMHV